MIKCHINKKKDKVWVHTTGTAQDMMVETAVLIQQPRTVFFTQEAAETALAGKQGRR